jgi:hypothetical protein
LTVERFDLVGDGEVLVGDSPVGDLRVAQRHVHAVVAEHGGDRLQAHAAVGLGGQRVTQLMRMQMRQPGGPAGPVDHPGDGVPVQCGAVRSRQQQRMIGRHVPGAVVVDQRDQVRV